MKKFATKKEELKYLVENKAELIRLKKSSIKYCDIVGGGLSVTKGKFAIKQDKQDTDDTIYRTIVGNTYNFMDSHDDVLLDGVFTKSISEKGKEVMHLADHEYKLTAKVGNNLKVYEEEIKWSDVGLDRTGFTTALFMDTEIKEKFNALIFDSYKNGEINQHSVGMSYVKLYLAVNDPEYKEEFAMWEKYFDKIANKELAEEKGYFWAVTEGKLYEISCVIKGANELTPTLDNKQEIDFSQLDEFKNQLLATIKDDIQKKNILLLCQNFEALTKGEPLELTLMKESKPSNKDVYKKLLS